MGLDERAEFEQNLSKDFFLEHEVIHGNKYGILKQTILDAQSQDIDILLNIDVNGTASLRRFYQSLFFLYSSISSLLR